jgi:cell division protein ZapA (FtsZ GTPase activity inhibitor)
MESIRINIAGREYPLNAPSHEVANLKQAAAKINAQYEAFQEQFQVDDPVDLLALTALHLSDSSSPASSKADELPLETLNRMNRISERIQKALEV